MRVRSRSGPGRRLEVPAGARPTSARARAALLSRWQSRLSGATLVDLFAGSGGVGFEALARGAAMVVFVDEAPAALAALRQNIAGLGEGDRCRIVRSRLPRGLDRLEPLLPEGATLAFADPPYGFPGWLSLLTALASLLAPEGELCVEHGRRDEPPPRAGTLVRFDSRRYGDTHLTFYRHAPVSEEVSRPETGSGS